VAKLLREFGLPKEEGLLQRTTCSMRKETNAVKDANVQFGDLYVFEHHLCFDWKVFGFRKQQVLSLTDVVALLKSHELPNTVEVQGKGYSYELTLPENFEEIWNTMEACRRSTTAAALQQASSAGTTAAPIYEEVDTQVEQAFGRNTARRNSQSAAGGPGISMDLTEADWTLFLSGARQRRYEQGSHVTTTFLIWQVRAGLVRNHHLPNMAGTSRARTPRTSCCPRSSGTSAPPS